MLKYNHRNKVLADNMRRRMTTEERLLWFTFLKNHELTFYPQRRIGRYIIDFYCPERKLAIELDGCQHNEERAIQYDEQRTKYLNAKGIRVVRYDNYLVTRYLDSVCYDIDRLLEEQKGRIN